MSKVAIALVHYPVLDRQGAVITTAITNLDLHDLSRSACTYGVSAVYIVHPVEAQRQLAERVQAHWVAGSGARRIPTREAALSLMRIVPSLEDVHTDLGGRANIDVYVTSARREQPGVLSYAEGRTRITASERTSLILFGTGWGLAPDVVTAADGFLAPLRGAHPTGYNHLSVRAACAIILDRLLSSDEPRA
jgi:hypothetical protein